jgi:hypothetical protein
MGIIFAALDTYWGVDASTPRDLRIRCINILADFRESVPMQN